jgi:toxin ParE1/3/4
MCSSVSKPCTARQQPRRRSPARNLVLRPAAEADLTELYHGIAERSGSPQTAILYIRRIRASCETLLTFPECGRARDDLRPGIRVFGFEKRVVIVYKILPSGDVEIGRFFYGGQDYEAIFREYGGD